MARRPASSSQRGKTRGAATVEAARAACFVTPDPGARNRICPLPPFLRNSAPRGGRHDARDDVMGSFGIWHWAVVLAVVLIIFGAGKLPNVMGDLAKGIKNFKSGMKDEDRPADPAVPPPVTDTARTGTPSDRQA
jgi:sec-independent protein translocase protein TatA